LQGPLERSEPFLFHWKNWRFLQLMIPRFKITERN
jgi:hypothetical protein